ncbi:long-chain fatty acid--CoA ligase [Herbaspirillum sp. RV1423]|uniref:AMP-dependent synthetase/ligase n=1 Tax=Herbaspirillum sp. RV1423 TaxID=1443993 RepID=UPI0004B8197E|nr:long-chain fatty acid--CoA ligase [Herbaspirillum sp. RV1423]
MNNTIVGLADIATLGQLFDWRLEQTPHNEAYRHFNPITGQWHSHNWEQIGERVRSWTSALAALGFPQGARIAILLPNGIDAVCLDQACLALGLVPVPMHALDNPASIAYILADCEATMLAVSTREQWDAIVGVGEAMPSLKSVLVTDDGDFTEHYSARHDQILVIALPAWLAGGVLPDGHHKPSMSGDALAAIVYTSGTTGRPKGVMLTHRNILSNIRAVMAIVNVESEDVFLSILPLSHTFERTVGYYLAIAAGSCVAYVRSVAQIAEDLSVIRPTVLVSVPRIYERTHAKLLEQLAASGVLAQRLFALAQTIGWRRFCRNQQLPSTDASRHWLDPLLFAVLQPLVARKLLDRFGGRLRIAVCGGAPLPHTVAECFLGLGLPLVQGYGMTETSPVVACNTPTDNWPATVGRPLAGVAVRIGENQELQVRGDGVMTGYWKRPEESARAMTPDGWLHTGDQAVLEDGRIRIIGRIKEIIVTSTGEKLAPADLELAITADPLFEQVFVVGDNRPFIAAFVVLSQVGLAQLLRELSLAAGETALDSPILREAVLRKVKQASMHFPVYAVPRMVWLTTQPWSLENGLMTPTLKLKRHVLLQHFHAEIDEIYAPHTPGQGMQAAAVS